MRSASGCGTPGDIAPRAARLEALGFDSVHAGEHVFFHGPTTNSLIALAVAAGATSTIGLLSAIVLLPLYPAAQIAKMASVLDVASGGRFRLGVGVGGEYPPEFRAVGVPHAERGRRSDEALEIITRLFTGERGAAHLQLNPACRDEDEPAMLALLAEEVLPLLRG